MGAPKWGYVGLFVSLILSVCSAIRMPLSKVIVEDPDDQPYKLSSTIDNVFFGTWGRTEGGGDDDPPDDDGIGAMGRAEGRREVDSAITKLDKCDGIGGRVRAEGGRGVDSAITKLAKCDTDDDGIGVMGPPSPPPSPYDGIGTWDRIGGGGDDDPPDDNGIGAMGPPSPAPSGTWGRIDGGGDDDPPDDDGIGAMGRAEAVGGVDSAITKQANANQEWTKGNISPTARAHQGNEGQISKP